MSNPAVEEHETVTEVLYQLAVPEDGGWGWVVVAASFYSFYVQSAIIFTFGALIGKISKELKIKTAPVVLIGSLQIALYFMMCPVASALINRYGFRACSMMGSLTASISMVLAYASRNYAELIVTFGILNGIGLSFLQMSALIIVGFYFEKRRALALAISSLGASLGTMIMFPVFSYLANLCDGWRSIVLFESGLTGSVYFTSLTYLPLPTIRVIELDDTYNPTRSVVTLPKTSTQVRTDKEATFVERIVGTVGNERYPTAATILQATVEQESNMGTAKSAASIANASNANDLKSIMSLKSTPGSISTMNVSFVQGVLLAKLEKRKKQPFWSLCCRWEEEEDEQRPLYRDDIFYEGDVKRLPTYQKTVMSVPLRQRTGFEYQMAVTRAISEKEIQKKHGICSIAVRRVLATMLDFTTLLTFPSFVTICISGFLSSLGLLTPYIFMTDRNNEEGLSGSFFVTVTALATIFGRLTFGIIGGKVCPVRLYWMTLLICGTCTMFSSFQFSYLYQYTYCFVYGFFVGGVLTLRCLALLTLYGLSKLTNAVGLFYIFLGIGCALGSPIAGAIKESYGYTTAFYFTGFTVVISGLMLIFIKPPVNVDSK